MPSAWLVQSTCTPSCALRKYCTATDSRPLVPITRMKLTVPGGDLFGAKGAMWANTGISKSLLDESLEVSLGINNLLDRGGFEMERTKPLYDDNGLEYANEFTDISTRRGGRTFKLNIIYRFGKMQEEKTGSSFRTWR